MEGLNLWYMWMCPLSPRKPSCSFRLNSVSSLLNELPSQSMPSFIDTTSYEASLDVDLVTQSATATSTPARVTLTWRCTWPPATSVGAYAMTVSTTPWDATVSSADPSTTSTRRGTSEILTSVKVSWQVSPGGTEPR